MRPLTGLTQDPEIREALVQAAESARELSPHVRKCIGAVWGDAIARLLKLESPSENELRAIHARICGAHDFALELNKAIVNARSEETSAAA